jgi:hypothetical protein
VLKCITLCQSRSVTVYNVVPVTICDTALRLSVTVCGGGPGGGSKFLPLYTSTLLLDRVSQKIEKLVVSFYYFLVFSKQKNWYKIFLKIFTWIFISVIIVEEHEKKNAHNWWSQFMVDCSVDDQSNNR